MVFKYVMINGKDPIIFTVAMTHSDFKNIGKITSAGFVQLSNAIRVFGESATLGLASDPKDVLWIEIAFKVGAANYGKQRGAIDAATL